MMRFTAASGVGRVAALLAIATVTVLAACSTTSGEGAPSSPAAASAWVDQEITFDSGGVTVHGTLHRPAGGAPVPAALIIAGSGPTDRNGDSRLLPGSMGTLKWLAGRLADAGVATLRYDKLGSGETGLGRFASDPSGIDADVFTGEVRDAWAFLAAQPSVDRGRMSAYGHSEGALFALQLAAAPATTPKVTALGLLEPLSLRYLDVIQRQIADQVTAAQRAGAMSAADGAELVGALTDAIAEARSSGTVPAQLPDALKSVFNPSTGRFLQQLDRIDPPELARTLPARFPALLTCSDADIQVSCADVDHLTQGFTAADLSFVRLTGVSHVLKQDPSRTGAHYGDDLPFSTVAGDAITAFARAH